jgi:hypothetical protein
MLWGHKITMYTFYIYQEKEVEKGLKVLQGKRVKNKNY